MPFSYRRHTKARRPEDGKPAAFRTKGPRLSESVPSGLSAVLSRPPLSSPHSAPRLTERSRANDKPPGSRHGGATAARTAFPVQQRRDAESVHGYLRARRGETAAPGRSEIRAVIARRPFWQSHGPRPAIGRSLSPLDSPRFPRDVLSYDGGVRSGIGERRQLAVSGGAAGSGPFGASASR